MGYGPRGCEELGMTEHTHSTHPACVGIITPDGTCESSRSCSLLQFHPVHWCIETHFPSRIDLNPPGPHCSCSCAGPATASPRLDHTPPPSWPPGCHSRPSHHPTPTLAEPAQPASCFPALFPASSPTASWAQSSRGTLSGSFLIMPAHPMPSAWLPCPHPSPTQ